MPFTPQARAAAKKAREAATARRRAAKQAGNAIVAEICSVNGVAMENLSVEAIEIIKKLQGDLDLAKKSIPASERLAVNAAEMQGGGQPVKEIFTGQYVEVERACDPADPNWRNKPPKYKVVGYQNNRAVLEPVMAKVKLPVYAYKIDLAPSHGDRIRYSGRELYHGMVVKLDEDSLRSVKDIVWRGWAHERNIKGSDENAYRPKTQQVISARG